MPCSFWILSVSIPALSAKRFKLKESLSFHLPPPGLQQKLVGPGIIRAFGQSGGSKCLIEFFVQPQAPGVDFGPGLVAAFDGQERVAVLNQAHAQLALAKGADAREQQTHEMH